MGYYMRFISTDEQAVTLSQLDSALKQSSDLYSIDRDESDDLERLIAHDQKEYAQIEINVPGDGLFEEEVDELIDFVSDVTGPGKAEVSHALKSACAIVAVQVLFQARSTEETLSKLDPLWAWLLDNRKGLMQTDGEGYYDKSGLILKVK
jgi:hypothetical protein